MRILYFTRGFTPHDLRFMTRIAERHEVLFLRLEDDGIDAKCGALPVGVREVEWEGGRSSYKHPEQWMRLIPAFVKTVESLRPDLIHAGPIQSCGLLTALSGFQPFLAMSWGSDVLVDAGRDAFWEWMSRYTLSRCGMLACDCEAVAARARELAGGRALPNVQFPWGIDLKDFTPGKTALHPQPDGWQDAFVIYSNRSWSEGYGVDTLLKAFAAAFHRQPRLRLILVGSGPLECEVYQLIHELGIASAVHMPGRKANAELAGLLRAADLYVSCASSDGTSISMLEAMATGLPVVVTDIASNREWVTPSVNGWLCADKDTISFSGAMLEAVALGSVERAQMGSANRELAEERANWEKNSLKLFQAYDALISGDALRSDDK